MIFITLLTLQTGCRSYEGRNNISSSSPVGKVGMEGVPAIVLQNRFNRQNYTAWLRFDGRGAYFTSDEKYKSLGDGVTRRTWNQNYLKLSPLELRSAESVSSEDYSTLYAVSLGLAIPTLIVSGILAGASPSAGTIGFAAGSVGWITGTILLDYYYFEPGRYKALDSFIELYNRNRGHASRREKKFTFRIASYSF